MLQDAILVIKAPTFLNPTPAFTVSNHCRILTYVPVENPKKGAPL